MVYASRLLPMNLATFKPATGGHVHLQMDTFVTCSAQG